MAIAEVASALFRGNRSKKLPCSGAKLGIGESGPRGMYMSETRRTKFPSSLNVAKINHAASVLQALFDGKIAALEGRDNPVIYAEYSGTSGNYSVNWAGPGSSYHWDKLSTSDNPVLLVTPIVLDALQRHNPNFPETKLRFIRCCEEFQKSGQVSDEALFMYCDAFYYELKCVGTSTVEQDEYLNVATVKQAVRTGSLEPFALFADLGLTLPAISVEAVPTKATEPKSAAVNDDQRYNDCKTGKYDIEYCWSPEQMAHIPDRNYLDSYVPGDTFFSLVDLIHGELSEVSARMSEGHYGLKAIQNNYVNAILVGKPGTGKTTLANALAATFQMPLRVVAPNKNSEEDLFTGMTKVSEGGFTFHETPFLDAFKNGGVILLEEFNLADQGVIMGALGQAVEKPFILAQDGYKEVTRHPLCVIIATMNSGAQGSREPSEAFTSRFPDSFVLEDPTEEQFLDILQSRGYKKAQCKKVYNAYCKCISALKTYNAEDVAMAVTMRHCFSALRQWVVHKKPLQEALTNTIIGAIATKDRVLAQEIYNSVIKVIAA